MRTREDEEEVGGKRRRKSWFGELKEILICPNRKTERHSVNFGTSATPFSCESVSTPALTSSGVDTNGC